MTEDSQLFQSFTLRQDQEISDAKRGLATICRLLQPTSVATILIRYDGYGDSGNIEEIAYLNAKGDSVNETAEPILGATRFDSIDGADSSIEATISARLEDLAFEVLPLGWEINEGSCGLLRLDVKTLRVVIEHTCRYVTTEDEVIELDVAEEGG